MDSFFDTLRDFSRDQLSNAWGWFNGLSREEWFVVLGSVALAGLLCMRGFGSRANY